MCMNNVFARHVNFQQKTKYCRATIQHAMQKIVAVMLFVVGNNKYGIAIAEECQVSCKNNMFSITLFFVVCVFCVVNVFQCFVQA